jgi:uncharacterized protein with HEPN domain
MSDQALLRLHDAIEACAAIEEFVAGISLDVYSADFKLRLQIERLLEIVGEALNQARSIDPTLTASIPDLPLIIGMRNQLIHGYHSINDDLVWNTATTRVGVLRVQLEAITSEPN